MKAETVRWRSPDFDDSVVEEEHKAQWSVVVPVPGLGAEQKAAIQRILALHSLPNNWDSYGSPPPSLVAGKTAIQIIKGLDLDSFLSPQVFAVPGGGIQLEWNHGERELEIEIDDEGSVAFLKVERGRPIEENGIAPVNAEILPLFTWLTT